MLFPRIIMPKIQKNWLKKGKITIIYGPRQAGKTTLIKTLFPDTLPADILFFNGDDLFAQNLFSRHELEFLKRTVGKARTLIIDEAQRIENIGLSLKLLIDNLPINIIVSGSSSFDLAGKISEPLTGRTDTYWLYPLSYVEVKSRYQRTSPDLALAEMLRYGMYPKIHTLESDEEKEKYLLEYVNNYLYKDIIALEGVKKPKKVIDLLVLLALQIGKEVAISELAKNLSLNQFTVQRYLDVLEKMFVIINLRGFARNLRKEINKTSKYYFVDIGARNALLRNFNSLSLRSDVGELFENWFIMEKIKQSHYTGPSANFYFWRTYDQQEIDMIEEKGGVLTGYECKWSEKAKNIVPSDWQKNYPKADYQIINRENFIEFI